MKSQIDDRRFVYYRTMGYIVDNLTGKMYRNLGELCDLLNEESDRADRNAEKYFDFDHVLRKYGIKSVDKLDLILFHKGVW